MNTIIKFYSPTCGPCKVLDKNLKTANIEYTSINVTDPSFEELIEKYQIHSVPTLVKLNGDKVVDKFVGIMTVDKLREWIK